MNEAAQSPIGFVRWLDRMADELGIDSVSLDRAAVLLGKSIRSVTYYAAGTIKPCRTTRMLMTLLAEGGNPRSPWPE